LTGAVERGLVLDGLTRGHHHTTTDGVQRVRSNTSTSSDRPAEQEGSQEVALKRTNQDDGLERVVHAEVQTTVDNDTHDGDNETTVQTGNTVGGEGLLVDVYETVELTFTSTLGRLGVVSQTGTSVVQGVDEEQGGSTGSLKKYQHRTSRPESVRTYTTRGQVTSHPPPVAVTLLLEGEHRLVGVTEGEVQGLGREVTDDVGSVTSPQRHDTLGSSGTAEALRDTGVLAVETTGSDHLILQRIIISSGPRLRRDMLEELEESKRERKSFLSGDRHNTTR
jgi:hypothetical protein